MATNENTGYLVQLKSPEGDNVYPVISAETIKDSSGETYDLSALKSAVESVPDIQVNVENIPSASISTTYSDLHIDSSEEFFYTRICSGGGYVVFIGSGNSSSTPITYYYHSSNGLNFSKINIPSEITSKIGSQFGRKTDITYFNGKFWLCAVNFSGTANTVHVFNSDDGLNWSFLRTISGQYWGTMLYINNKYVFVGSSFIETSPDLSSWDQVSFSSFGTCYSKSVHAGCLYMTVLSGPNARIVRSSDLTSFEDITSEIPFTNLNSYYGYQNAFVGNDEFLTIPDSDSLRIIKNGEYFANFQMRDFPLSGSGSTPFHFVSMVGVTETGTWYLMNGGDSITTDSGSISLAPVVTTKDFETYRHMTAQVRISVSGDGRSSCYGEAFMPAAPYDPTPDSAYTIVQVEEGVMSSGSLTIGGAQVLIESGSSSTGISVIHNNVTYIPYAKPPKIITCSFTQSSGSQDHISFTAYYGQVQVSVSSDGFELEWYDNEVKISGSFGQSNQYAYTPMNFIVMY